MSRRRASVHTDEAGHTPASRVTALLGDHVHLVKGAFGVMISTVVASIAGWLFWLIATHRWPTSQVGVATSLVAALSVIALIAGQPIATTILARLPRSDRRAGIFEVGVVLAGAIALVLSFAAIALLPHSLHVVRSPGMAVLFTVGSVAGAIGVVLDAASLSVRRPGLLVVRNGVLGVGKMLVLAVIALPAGLISGPFAVITAWAVVSVAADVIAGSSWLRRERQRAVHSADERRAHRRYGWSEVRRGFGAQVLGSLGGTLPPQILPIIVITVLGTMDAAWFSITWLVGGLCFMISPAVCQALLAEGSLRPEQLSAKTRSAVLLSSALLAPPLLIYVFFGHVVLSFFGASYAANGSTLLAILAVSAIPDLVTNVAVARFRVEERLWAAAVVNVTIAAIAVGGSVWALDRYGINGAGWAWTAGEVVGCLLLPACALVARRRPPRPAVGTVALGMTP